MNFLKLILCAGFIFLGACEKQDIVAHAHYLCDTGIEMDTTFTNGEQAKITVGEVVFDLARVESELGAKYEGAGAVFWSKGQDANFVMVEGTEPLKCRRS